MSIQRLNNYIINQIAAGEVIERPANVVKELIENAIDAQAHKIDVTISHGGKGLIRISDDGVGIPKEELALAISRHCTSKIRSDINQISTLGFRGEALPAIGSISQLSLFSRVKKSDFAYKITMHGDSITEIVPVSSGYGTTVEVKNLFYTTPARLKFMKSEHAESMAITDCVKRLSIAFPDIHFSLFGTQKKALSLSSTVSYKEPYFERIVQIFGHEFSKSIVPISTEREDVFISGYISLPSFTKATNSYQFLYVNGRPIKDRILLAAIRVAFLDIIPKDRHGIVILFLKISPIMIDVNVHPAKSDVRFKDPGLIKGLIIGAIRDTLTRTGIQSPKITSNAMINAFREPSPKPYLQKSFLNPSPIKTNGSTNFDLDRSELNHPSESQISFICTPSVNLEAHLSNSSETDICYPLGVARTQIHENYIITQTKDGMTIIDQHAAHERILYEKLKSALYKEAIPSQLLLVPEIISLCESEVQLLLSEKNYFSKMGLDIDAFGQDAIAVRGLPDILNKINIPELIHDLIDDLSCHSEKERLKRKMDHVLATISCHGSVRSGRRLKADEMNRLLRDIEQTPEAATCNHGRPTYIELKLADIQKLFGRK